MPRGPVAQDRRNRSQAKTVTMMQRTGRGPARTTLVAVLAALMVLVGVAFVGTQRDQARVNAPFAYAQTEEPASPHVAALAEWLYAEPLVMELQAPGEDRVLARAEAARMPDGTRRLLSWQPAVAGPMLRGEIRADEEKRLIEALRKHLPAGSTILAMPETSRRLAAFVEAEFPLASAVAPLLLPAQWQGAAEAARAVDTAVWADAAVAIDESALAPLLEALLAEDANGAARLRVLAGTGDAYALVHLRDAFAMAILRPDRFAMVQRSFVTAKFSHDLAREARTWGRAQGHAAYAIDRDPQGRLRGHFLTGARETATLLAQLLPFNSTRLGEVPGMRLVWQGGGYWLYRIAPLDPA